MSKWECIDSLFALILCLLKTQISMRSAFFHIPFFYKSFIGEEFFQRCSRWTWIEAWRRDAIRGAWKRSLRRISSISSRRRWLSVRCSGGHRVGGSYPFLSILYRLHAVVRWFLYFLAKILSVGPQIVCLSFRYRGRSCLPLWWLRNKRYLLR